MPAEVLVMCSQCGRPQPVGERCVACGAALPGAFSAAAPAEAPAPLPVTLEVGPERRLLLTLKRLEWREKEHPPLVYELTEIKGITLHVRPLFAALGFLVPMLMSLTLGRVFRIAGLLLGGVALVACFGLRRYTLRVHTTSGHRAELLLGYGRPGSHRSVRALEVWQTLAPALRARGLQTGGGEA